MVQLEAAGRVELNYCGLITFLRLLLRLYHFGDLIYFPFLHFKLLSVNNGSPK